MLAGLLLKLSGIASLLKEIVKKVPWWVWVVVAALTAGFIYVQSLKRANTSLREQLSQIVIRNGMLIKLNDSMSVRAANDILVEDSLQSSLSMAKQLNSELIAAARIRLTPDTVFRTITVRGEILDPVTGIRLAQFSDTTSAGILDAVIRIPPMPNPIGFDYVFKPAPVTFEVSLLRTSDNHAIFGVTYPGGTSEISVPYAKLPRKPVRFVSYLEGMYEPVNSIIFGRLGFRWNPFWRIYGFGEVQQNLTTLIIDKTNTTARLGIGFHLIER